MAVLAVEKLLLVVLNVVEVFGDVRKRSDEARVESAMGRSTIRRGADLGATCAADHAPVALGQSNHWLQIGRDSAGGSLPLLVSAARTWGGRERGRDSH